MHGRRKLFPHSIQKLTSYESENLNVKPKNQKLLEEKEEDCLKDIDTGK